MKNGSGKTESDTQICLLLFPYDEVNHCKCLILLKRKKKKKKEKEKEEEEKEKEKKSSSKVFWALLFEKNESPKWPLEEC